MKNNAIKGVVFAVLAALFYSINVPISKLLLTYIPETMMASFLYLGAGIGVSFIYLFRFKAESKSDRLVKSDIPYTIGMVVLDILAPIFLMLGINKGTASNASLLGNFEIVATTLIALLIFKEKVSFKLWIGILFILISCSVLSFRDVTTFQFSIGSLFVLLATLCWGLENNCTKKISNKSTYQIVMIKGLCSGAGSFIISMILKEQIPEFKYIIFSMLLGFVAYGLSIFTYIRAQRYIGASKTSAFYAIAPFIGVGLSFVILKEQINYMYIIALMIMIIGIIFVVLDVLLKKHQHSHTHLITHTRDGITHTHMIEHNHMHYHSHRNRKYINSRQHLESHSRQPKL